VTPRKPAPSADPAYERITHGRHCVCTPCSRQDWALPELAACGMHGPDCPRSYQPWGAPGTYVARGGAR
jgi:hypothetical protein